MMQLVYGQMEKWLDMPWYDAPRGLNKEVQEWCDSNGVSVEVRVNFHGSKMFKGYSVQLHFASERDEVLFKTWWQ